MIAIRLLLISGMILIGPILAVACTCEYSSIRAAFKHSKIVFRGKAINVSDGDVTFQIEKIWKGKLPKEVKVRVEGNAFTGECGDGFAFENGETYAVFLHSRELLTINICTRNFHITESPNPRKFDKTVAYQKNVLDKLNDPLFRFWARIYPF